MERYWYVRVPLNALIDEHLSSTARLVYVALCRHTNAHGVCWPGYKALKATTGINSENTLHKAIKELEDAGHISVIRRRGESNYYTITEIRRRLKDGKAPGTVSDNATGG